MLLGSGVINLFIAVGADCQKRFIWFLESASARIFFAERMCFAKILKLLSRPSKTILLVKTMQFVHEEVE